MGEFGLLGFSEGPLSISEIATLDNIATLCTKFDLTLLVQLRSWSLFNRFTPFLISFLSKEMEGKFKGFFRNNPGA